MSDEMAVKLHETMDADVWAREFTKMFLSDKHGESCQCGEDNRGYLDLDTMRAWFANSIMCGWDHANWKRDKETLAASAEPSEDTKGKE